MYNRNQSAFFDGAVLFNYGGRRVFNDYNGFTWDSGASIFDLAVCTFIMLTGNPIFKISYPRIVEAGRLFDIYRNGAQSNDMQSVVKIKREKIFL